MQELLTTKYQPLKLSDFKVNNDSIALIQSLISMETLNVLLVGDRGTGKSVLIQSIVNEYYGNESSENNILTITTLKDQGISYYRTEVKTFCQTASIVPGKKKILVLDDLDSINEQSQQVFRNCMDKYGQNILFIASCTNTQKIIDSIQSRMTLIKLKVFTNSQLEYIAKTICLKENIEITDDARNFMISICNNSLRILINYLEKFKLIQKKIHLDMAITSCTNIPFKEFEKYTLYCKNNDKHNKSIDCKNNLHEALQIIKNLFDMGYSVMDILDSYFLFIKTTHILSEEEKYKVTSLICNYITIFHNIHEDEIELAFFTNNVISILSD